MTPTHYQDEQRLAFGRVAELYDRARPSYPAAAIDAVLGYGGLSPGTRIVEVGAGTGKATELLAGRGLAVLALEPSAEMAAVARARCAQHPGVQIVESEFESWRPEGRFFAVVSVQAWHWIAPDARYLKAHETLVDGGTLAAIWSFPNWQRCTGRDSLRQAYRTAASDLSPDFPMHPDSEPTRLAGQWEAEVEAGGRFTEPEIQSFAWTQTYTRDGYLELLGTHQDHILLDPADRSRLLGAVGQAIDGIGGSLELPLTTFVCLARRS